MLNDGYVKKLERVKARWNEHILKGHGGSFQFFIFPVTFWRYT
jgi:hypothetical protein